MSYEIIGGCGPYVEAKPIEEVTLYRYVYKKGEIIVEKHVAEHRFSSYIGWDSYIVRKPNSDVSKYHIPDKKIDTVYQAAGMYIMWSLTDDYDTQLKFINKLCKFLINKEKKIYEDMEKLDEKIEVIGDELVGVMDAEKDLLIRGGNNG